jgi:Catalytic LigB subunit of aromatic ring-opening dioxygenase
MAQIVLAIGTSHGPMLSTPPQGWDLRLPDDRRNIHAYRGRDWSFEELVAERRGEHLEAQIIPEVWRRRHATCRAALTTLARVFEEAHADVAILFGDDQMECFRHGVVPSLGVFYGDQFDNSELEEERLAALPPGIAPSVPGHIPPGGATYPGAPQLALHILTQVQAEGFDLCAIKQLPGDETPHAFGFLCRQIMNDQVIPSIPVFINTFYPPNQPTAARCARLGRSILRAIQSWPADTRVVLLASGGLSHFVIDEKLDKYVLDAIRGGDIAQLAELPESVFRSGTSEIKNWIPVIAAMSELGVPAQVVDYVPCYRSLAGTGNAMGFVYWKPE